MPQWLTFSVHCTQLLIKFNVLYANIKKKEQMFIFIHGNITFREHFINKKKEM